ncbi:hypothetical protein HYY75_02950 [bacterium]|nr:hypothetical protein [bacterium]
MIQPFTRISLKKIYPILLAFFLIPCDSWSLPEPSSFTNSKKPAVIDKTERSFGLRWFRMNGYHDFVEPRIAFIKRKSGNSEVIEYSWRPMRIVKMPNHERIDRIQCSFNRYFFGGRKKNIFYGFGAGGNVILFNKKLHEWGKQRKIFLSDGVNGLGRLFAGYKLRDISVGKTKYPLVFRVDGLFSPPYRFGGELGRAGDKLKLSEVTANFAFSIE